MSRNLVIIFFFTITIYSCGNSFKYEIQGKDTRIGEKLNLMSHTVEFHNGQGKQSALSDQKKFKIVTYGDLYCDPCFQNVKDWNDHIEFLDQFDNVNFICYVRARKSDFEERNKVLNLKFPVYLDQRDRFRIVNKIETLPDRLTFLLNDKNEILLVGAPFTSEMQERYADVLKN